MMKDNDLTHCKDLTGEGVAKGITNGGTSLSGDGISFMQLVMIRQALDLQGKGIGLSRRLPAGTTMARKWLGLKGNREKLLAQVDDIIARIQRERREYVEGVHGE